MQKKHTFIKLSVPEVYAVVDEEDGAFINLNYQICDTSQDPPIVLQLSHRINQKPMLHAKYGYGGLRTSLRFAVAGELFLHLCFLVNSL